MRADLINLEDTTKKMQRIIGQASAFIGLGMLTPVIASTICQVTAATTDFSMSVTAMKVLAGVGFALYFGGIFMVNQGIRDDWKKNIGAPLFTALFSIGISSYLLPHLVPDWGLNMCAVGGMAVGILGGLAAIASKQWQSKGMEKVSHYDIAMPIVMGLGCALGSTFAPLLANTITDSIGLSLTFSTLMTTMVFHWCVESKPLLMH